MKYSQDDLSAVARTAWGEARGEGVKGLIAVTWVILNRFIKRPHEFGTSLYDVCHKHEQFDCWNEGDPNRGKCIAVDENEPMFSLALAIAQAVLDGKVQDPTKGATHYCVSTLNPKWSIGHTPSAVIGHQKFYNDVA